MTREDPQAEVTALCRSVGIVLPDGRVPALVAGLALARAAAAIVLAHHYQPEIEPASRSRVPSAR